MFIDHPKKKEKERWEKSIKLARFARIEIKLQLARIIIRYERFSARTVLITRVASLIMRIQWRPKVHCRASGASPTIWFRKKKFTLFINWTRPWDFFLLLAQLIDVISVKANVVFMKASRGRSIATLLFEKDFYLASVCMCVFFTLIDWHCFKFKGT